MTTAVGRSSLIRLISSPNGPMVVISSTNAELMIEPVSAKAVNSRIGPTMIMVR